MQKHSIQYDTRTQMQSIVHLQSNTSGQRGGVNEAHCAVLLSKARKNTRVEVGLKYSFQY